MHLRNNIHSFCERENQNANFRKEKRPTWKCWDECAKIIFFLPPLLLQFSLKLYFTQFISSLFTARSLDKLSMFSFPIFNLFFLFIFHRFPPKTHVYYCVHIESLKKKNQFPKTNKKIFSSFHNLYHVNVFNFEMVILLS